MKINQPAAETMLRAALRALRTSGGACEKLARPLVRRE